MATSVRSDHNAVLKEPMGGGPHGLGDPEDQSLRKVEVNILIPQKMKARAKVEICQDIVRGFGECAKEAGLLLPFKCRTEAKHLHKCLSESYKNQAFIDSCTTEYLKERTEYRRTGIKQKDRRKEMSTL